MRTFYECLPCFVNQALGLLKSCNATKDQIENAMRSVFCELADIDFGSTPPVTAQKICRIVAKAVGIADPFAYEKRRFNDFAAGLLPAMQKKLAAERNVFSAKVKLAIAANIIDFGKNINLTEADVLPSFERALETPIDNSAVASLQDAIQSSGNILFLCDNAGEIVFDRFLIEEMPRANVTCAVRGMPVINDATLDDARAVGLTDFVRVISNGSGAPGTILEECSTEFKQVFDDADIVIAKGQGNFETLSGITDKRIFYLLQVKCPIIARDIGNPVGSFVIKDSGAGQPCNQKTCPNCGQTMARG